MPRRENRPPRTLKQILAHLLKSNPTWAIWKVGEEADRIFRMQSRQEQRSPSTTRSKKEKNGRSKVPAHIRRTIAKQKKAEEARRKSGRALPKVRLVRGGAVSPR